MPNRINKFLGAIFLLGSLWAQAQGTVAGTVLDEAGKPLAKAKVHIAPKGAFAGHRVVQFYETDEAGRFLIRHVPWGTYVVLAGKEDAGYPDTAFVFYSNLSVPTVKLAPDFAAADVNLKLGPKAGFLEVAPVTDKVTGKEIRSAAITLRRSGSDFFLTASATEGHIPVPSMTEVTIEITAVGYKPWPSPNEANDKSKITLRPEEILKLQVSLQPEEPIFGDEKK